MCLFSRPRWGMWRMVMSPMQTGDMEMPTTATNLTEIQIMVTGATVIRYMETNLMETAATMTHRIGR